MVLKSDTMPRRALQYTERDCEELRKTDPNNVKACHAAGYECDYVSPYGFVPEAGCPRHD